MKNLTNMATQTKVGDFVMDFESGEMGVVENVSGDGAVIEVRMRSDERLVTVTADEFDRIF